jgi:Aldo/keto reductase family
VVSVIGVKLQYGLNWLLQRPTVSTVLIGARNEEQLRQNLGAVGWNLSAEQIAKLDTASAVTPPYPYYPYWNGQFSERNPAPFPAQPGAGIRLKSVAGVLSAWLCARRCLTTVGPASPSRPVGPLSILAFPERL